MSQEQFAKDPDVANQASEIYKGFQAEREPSLAAAEAGPDKDPIALFNRNLDGQNPDLDLADRDQPADHEVSPKLATELLEHHQLTDPETGQEISCLKLNWPPATGQAVRVMALSWSQDTENTGATGNLIEQAAKQLGGPIIVVNNPGMAGSDKSTSEQRKDLRSGDFRSLATVTLRSLKNEGHEAIEPVGYSMGGREVAAMIAVAPDVGVKINQAVIVESPGAVEFGKINLATRFGQNEAEHLKFYQETTQDEKLTERLGDNSLAKQSQIKAALGLFRAVKPDLRGNVSEYLGLAKATLGEDILVGLLKNPDLQVTLIAGGASELVPQGAYGEMRQDIIAALVLSTFESESDALSEQYHALSTKSNDELTAEGSPLAQATLAARQRLRLQVLPGDTHSFGEEGRRIIGYVADALKP